MPVTLNTSTDATGKTKYELEAAEAAYVTPTYSTTCRTCGKTLGTESASARIGQCYECSQAAKTSKKAAKAAEPVREWGSKAQVGIEARAALGEFLTAIGATPAAKPAKQTRRPKGTVVSDEERRAAARARKAKSRAANPERESQVNKAATARYRATHQDERRTYRQDYNARRAAALVALQAGIITPDGEQALAEVIEIVRDYGFTDGWQPSKYQAAILDWVKDGSGNAVVDAKAGAGKSTTLKRIAELLNAPTLVVAFNKAIVEDMTPRMAGFKHVQVSTMHSYGRRQVSASVGNTDVKQFKYNDLAEAHVKELVGFVQRGDQAGQKRRMDAKKFLVDLVNHVRETLCDPRDRAAINDVLSHFNMFMADGMLEAALIERVGAILDEGMKLCRQGIIDFGDMVWYPVAANLQCEQSEYVLVDEAQDLNAAQLALSIKACSGRLIYVGDPNQAIYGFSGADPDSIYKIIDRLHATVLPLNYCYRCPRSHVALAQAIVPAIEAAPNAAEGIVEYLSEAEMTANLKQGDMVICRTTAPLIGLCIRLIKAKVPARVKGRDIVKMLEEVIKAVMFMPSYDGWSTFNQALDDYEADTTSKLLQREHSEAAVQSLSDRCECIRTCYTEWHAESAEALGKQLKDLFVDDEAHPFIELMTVHRAKGGEAKNVVIIDYKRIRLTWKGQQEWEAQQEANLEYVALTRAMEKLTIVM